MSGMIEQRDPATVPTTITGVNAHLLRPCVNTCARMYARRYGDAYAHTIAAYVADLLELCDVDLAALPINDVSGALLNGAADWVEFSEGSSLIYDEDIIARFGGAISDDKVLIYQARALAYAADAITLTIDRSFY